MANFHSGLAHWYLSWMANRFYENPTETCDAGASCKRMPDGDRHPRTVSEIYFDRLGLVIVDEQHRFGVAQRLSLREKGQNLTRIN